VVVSSGLIVPLINNLLFIREGSFVLICIGLAGFGFFGFSAYPMALELAAEATYPIDASISESWVHVNVQVMIILVKIVHLYPSIFASVILNDTF
jgi:hypothetical protein